MDLYSIMTAKTLTSLLEDLKAIEDLIEDEGEKRQILEATAVASWVRDNLQNQERKRRRDEKHRR